MAFEVYFGNAGVWERVVLEGSGTASDLVIKTATDSLRARIVGASTSMAILLKSASDNLRSSIADSSALVSSGASSPIASDLVRAAISEKVVIAVFISTSDGLTTRIDETRSISGNGTDATYGGGLYGSGVYGS